LPGVDPVAGPEQAARLRSLRFTLLTNPENVSYKAKFRMGEFTLDEAIYRPIVKLLDLRVHSLEEILQHPTTRDIGYGKLVHALSILMATGQITLAMPEASEGRRQATTRALNQVIMQQTRMGADWPWLVSPVTGGGVSINTMEQMFLYFLAVAPKEVIPQVWQVMQSTNQRLVVQGNVLKTNEENMQELTRMLDNFTSKRLPLLRRLQIANL
ncbi:MAG: hypothetical protein G8345_17210, partial [Magnetococcales bacterium]|nr:hypothetical protein [Magnetococcales bacterium]